MQPPKTKANAPGSKFRAAEAGSGKSKAGAASKKPKVDPASVAGKFPHLFEAQRARRGIGQGLPTPKNLSRYVRWPKYVRLQRQKAILKQRIKVPPAINQFTRALDKNAAAVLFRLLYHYRPESRVEKKQRLLKQAGDEAKSGKTDVKKQGEKPAFIKYGLNHLTSLVESKRAKLVVIAHDVDPIELVVWLPALCRKMGVPYCIVKGKARLGQLVHKKTVTAVAVTDFRSEDSSKFDQIISSVRQQYNDDASNRRKWGGGILGHKAQHGLKKRQAASAAAAQTAARRASL